MKNKIAKLVMMAVVPCLASTAFAKVDYIFHEVDVQKTFWKGLRSDKDGPLAVSETPAITENVMLLKYLAKASGHVKSVASKDHHTMNEVKFRENNSEFHKSDDGSFPGFPQHGMAGVSGEVGDSRIAEVEVFDQAHQLTVHHHVESGTGLKLVPFDTDMNLAKILDPKTEVVIEKNGQNSYSVWTNPYTDEIYHKLESTLKPKAIIVYGVATDFCVAAFVQGARQRGYTVEVVKDAIAGVFPNSTAEKLKEMETEGAQFVTTDEVIGELGFSRGDLLKNATQDLQNRLRD